MPAGMTARSASDRMLGRSCVGAAPPRGLGGSEGVEEQAGLGVPDAGKAADALQDEVELGQAAAAQLHHEVPCSSGGVKPLDLGVATDLAATFCPSFGAVTNPFLPERQPT